MYIKRLLIVAIITLLIAYCTGSLFDHIYKKRWQTIFFEKSDELIKGHTNYDIIFLGNSRVHFGINPYYIDSVTKLNSYNFGNGAADATDIMLTADVYLQNHHAPKLAILSLDIGVLDKNETLQTRFHYLFYLQNDSINKYMEQAGFLTPLIKAFPFMKYSFFDEYNRSSLFVKGKPYPIFDHNIYRGFLNIQQQVNARSAGIFNTPKSPVKILSDTAIAYLRTSVAELHRKGSMVVFVSPPEKKSSPIRESEFKKITDSIFNIIANEYHVQYLHFENNTLFTDEYFVDDIHLNEPGTRIYSLQLADSIKRIFPYIK